MSATPTKSKVERRRSREIFERGEKILVGGVNSPVRAFRSVGGEPLIIERGSGQYLYDADGNELLDYVCSWGAMLLGHATSRCDAGDCGTSAARNELRGDNGARTGARHIDHASDSGDREDSIRFERHGSHDERGETGPRGHEARFHREI